MTVDPGWKPDAGRLTRADIVLDGLFAGMIGALAVAGWFLVLDLVGGNPLHTPALLGTVLLRGDTAAQAVSVAPLEISVYTAFHFLAFLAVGLLFSYLMALFEQFPIAGFVLFLSLQLGFFVIDLVLGAQLFAELRPWSVVIANLLAATTMAWYLWRRHPGIKHTLRHVWDQR